MNEFLQWSGWIDLTMMECVLGLLLTATFTVRYQIQTGGAWRRTSEGRWMMYGRLLIASVLALTLINYFFRGYPGQRIVSFLFFTVYVAHLYWPHVLLARAQRDMRDREMERIINDGER